MVYTYPDKIYFDKMYYNKMYYDKFYLFTFGRHAVPLSKGP